MSYTRWKRDNVIHQEHALGLTNIYTKLHDMEGNNVESVEIIPDKGVKIDLKGEKLDYLRIRLIQQKQS